MEHLPAAASLAVRDLLVGPRQVGQVVAVFPTCAYADIGGVLVALEVHDALRLPCALVLGIGRETSPFATVRVGDAAVAGDGELGCGDLVVRVARWWAPATPRGAMPTAAARTDEHCKSRWESLVLGLLGAGPGLTPAGDDVLAGLLLGLAADPWLRDPLAAAVLHHAPSRTNWLSAELLRHAADGLGIPAAVAVADSLAGHGTHGDLGARAGKLLTVGHTSGRALAHGLLLAAETLRADRVGAPA